MASVRCNNLCLRNETLVLDACASLCRFLYFSLFRETLYFIYFDIVSFDIRVLNIGAASKVPPLFNRTQRKDDLSSFRRSGCEKFCRNSTKEYCIGG